MQQQNSNSVLVGSPDRAQGIVTEADIISKVVALHLDTSAVKVCDIMSAPLISVDIKTPVYEIYRTLAEHKIRHVVIMDNGQQAGFLSVKDLLRRPII